MPRRAMPASERERTSADAIATLEVPTTKAIEAAALAESGKLAPAGLGTSGILPEEDDEETVAKRYVPLLKANLERREIIGIVLEPETVDAHGDIYDADVIADAAHDFLARFNATSTLGLMHKDMKRDFDLLESWTAPLDLTLGDRSVKSGTWLIMVKVNDDKIWDKVKKGEITGFSIGGKAKVKKLTADKE